jgi:ADP-heptose:LPS heptosyltransferase
LEKYFPLDLDKYITIHPYSKGSKTYDFWIDVLQLIKPALDKNDIKVLQIGAKGEQPLPHCHAIVGQTSINQIAYVIKGSMLHLGVDSFPVHIASHYDKKIVSLYSNLYPQNAGPYWGDKKDHVLLEPCRDKLKPSFSNDEMPKSLNSIRPEKIARSVLELLGLEFNYDYETIYVGESHVNMMLEGVPNQIVNPKSLGVDNMIMRMDFEFNEENLIGQLQVFP